jgi:hypothetical protein
MRIMKKELKKQEIKETEGIKFMLQHKYLGLNLQNTGRLTAHIDYLKIKLKKNEKRDFSTWQKIPLPHDILEILLLILLSTFLITYKSYELKLF